MSLENRPMRGENFTEKNKGRSEVERKKTNLIGGKGLVILALAGMSKEARAEISWKDIAIQFGIHQAQKMVENFDRRKNAKKDEIATFEGNKNFRFPFDATSPDSLRFDVLPSEYSRERGQWQRYSRSNLDSRFIDSQLQVMLQNLFPESSFVANIRVVDEESKVRRREEANQDIDNSTLAEPIIQRGNVYAQFITEAVIRSESDLRAYQEQYGWNKYGGLKIDFEKTGTVVQGVIKFTNRSPLTNREFVGTGTELEFSHTEFEKYAEKKGFGFLVNKVNWSPENKAIARLFMNAENFLQVIIAKDIEKMKKLPDNKVHHTGEDNNEINPGTPTE